ncbi:MAG: glucose-1-phosphate adenylyltransferase, partial [Opitutales bacterium]|nr:glucose-1-phosphate adenylyltransferase [Opitutales bacterium]
DSVVMMGADMFETQRDFDRNKVDGRPNIGVGKNSIVKHASLDKNVRIGDNVVLDPTGLPDNFGPGVEVAIRDGVLVVTKDAIVPDGFVLKA